LVLAPDRAESSRDGPAEGQARRETLIAEATDAAYRVALLHGFHGSFLDLELDLWRNLEHTISHSRTWTRLQRQITVFHHP
jgi:hypothetical protein